jgi:hypothetical protein
MCCCGLNQIASLAVPTSISSDGAALDVSGLVADKTVELCGQYNGTYTIMGSHDGSLYVPLLNFDSGSSSQTVKQAVSAVMHFMKVRRSATNNDPSVVTVNIAARAAVNCAKSGPTGANQFITLATLGAGLGQGPQPAVDLWSLVAATGLDDFNVACGGDFSGTLALEGSLDGVNFSPVGEDASGAQIGGFTLGSKTNTLGLVPAMPVLLVSEIVRFVRINNLGAVLRGPVNITIGGKQNCDC